MKPRTRIAPSPTGDLHIGHLRTILFNYALAKQGGGHFVVRIEDTDRERFVEGAMDRTLDVISAYGLSWDEGPRIGGDFGPYIQSERLEYYKRYAEQLVEQGMAYYCFLTEEETKALQENLRLEGKKLRSPYRDASQEEITRLMGENKPYVIRLKVPEGQDITFEDAILGTITYNTNELDDQILIKSDGFPTYHMGVVVDDHLMEITHVLRGNDWLPSTPKHILLYKAFGWELPVFAHLPNLKEKGENKKLSKRYGAVFAVQFLQDGYLPEAVLNFLMLLGWSSPEERVHGEAERELFTLDDFVKLFALDRVQKSALISFDREKLIWFNKAYMKSKSDVEVTELFYNWLSNYAVDRELLAVFESDYQSGALKAKVALVKERSETLVELAANLRFFYTQPEQINWEIKQVDSFRPVLQQVLSAIAEVIGELDDLSASWKQESWVEQMRNINTTYSLKGGDSFMALRIAVVGFPFSPPLFETLQLLGKEEVLRRLKTAQ